MTKKQSRTAKTVRNVSKSGGQTRNKSTPKATTNMELIVIIFLIGFGGGFGFYGMLRVANAVGLSIGTATNKDMFGVGTWFRYDDNIAVNTGLGYHGYYLITNITGITTAGDPRYGDPIAAQVLGTGARWYIWNITIYDKVTNVVEPPKNIVTWTIFQEDQGYLASADWSALFKYLIYGYGNASKITTTNFNRTDSFNISRPMFVQYGLSQYAYFSTYSTTSTTGVYSYIHNKSFYVYPGIPNTTTKQGVNSAYDPDTGILLWMSGKASFLGLTAFSIKNPLATSITKLPAPQYSLINTAPSGSTISTDWGIYINNYDSNALYEMAIASSNQSVIKSALFVKGGSQPIQFSTQIYTLNVLAIGTTTLSIFMRSTEYGFSSNYTNATYSFSSIPSGTPSTVTTSPTTPIVTITGSNQYNGTVFLSWTTSGGSPSVYQIWAYDNCSGGTFYSTSAIFGQKSSSWYRYIAATVSASITKYTFYNVYGTVPYGEFIFVVIAVNGIGSSPTPTTAPAIYLVNKAFLTPPTKPTSFSLTIANYTDHSNVTLSWSSVANATNFGIYRSFNLTITNTSSPVLIKTIQVLSSLATIMTYVDKLPPMYVSTVYYVIVAINSFGMNMSTVKSVKTTNTASYITSHETIVPPAPMITVSPITSNDGFVNLNWTAVPANYSSYGFVTSYQIWAFNQLHSAAYNLSVKLPDDGVHYELMYGYQVATISASLPLKYTFVGDMGTGLFCFAVLSVNTIGRSIIPLSSTFTGVNITAKAVITVPPTPTPFTVNVVNGESVSNITLSWGVSENATSYNIYRSIGESIFVPSGTTILATITGTSYVDKLTSAGTNVYYVVDAVNSVGRSPFSSVKTAYVTVVPTHAPATTLTKVDNSSVSWDVIPSAVAYTLYVNNGTVFYKFDLYANVTAYNFNGFLPSSTWSVTIGVKTAINTYESVPSNMVTITVLNATQNHLQYAITATSISQPFDYTTLALPIIVGIVVVIAVILIWNRRAKLFKRAPISTSTNNRSKATAPPTV